VLPIEYPLCFQKLSIEGVEWQLRRQYGMLDIEQAVIPRLQGALFSDP
jgi:hypothetical protein